MLKQQIVLRPDLSIFLDVYRSSEVMLMARLDNLIGLHFRVHTDPDFYSAELAYTTRALNRTTRLFKGRTVFGLIQDRLLVEARLLLSRSHLSVKQITYELGFEDSAYFCRWFKKMTGCTAKEYRRKNN